MKIGNNIHTRSNKKAYRKPVLEVVEIDREVSLTLVTNPPDDGGGGDNGTLPVGTNSSQPDYGDEYTYPKKDSPFGGGTVDFQR